MNSGAPKMAGASTRQRSAITGMIAGIIQMKRTATFPHVMRDSFAAQMPFASHYDGDVMVMLIALTIQMKLIAH
jgi:hypothetical protein